MSSRSRFYHDLGLSLNAGLPLDRALRTLKRPELAALADGRPLEDILRAARLPDLDVAILKAADEAGRLDQALKRLSKDAEAAERMEKRLRTMSIVPIVTLHAAVIIPWIAAGIIGEIDPWALLQGLAVIWILILGITALLKSSLINWLPMIGPIVREFAVARYCRSLDWSLEAAIPLKRALRLAADTAGPTIGPAARRIADEDVGRPLVEILAPVLPPLTLEILRVGEESGSVNLVLQKAAQSHEDSAQFAITKSMATAKIVLIVGVILAMIIQIALQVPGAMLGR